MAIDRALYEGRYEALVKHTFLHQYLPKLVNKVSFARDTFVYVDGFAGPWKSADEQGFVDTSFGISLKAMLEAQRTQLGRGRKIRMVAHLVELEDESFLQLEQLAKEYPTIEVYTYHGEFQCFLPAILNSLNLSDFCFSFIDPKGFDLDLDMLKPLLVRPSSEVFVNFMFDHANRFVSHPNQGVKDTINAMLLGSDWRARLDAAQSPSERESIILEAFKEGLKQTGNYKFVPSLTVQKTLADRTYYHLVFGTRHPEGLSVFRDCQIKALEAQAQIRASEKSKANTRRTGQAELFGGADTVQHDPSSLEISEGKSGSIGFAKQIIHVSKTGIHWSDLWPVVLEKFTVREIVLARAIYEMHRAGTIKAPDWRTDRYTKPRDGQMLLPLC